MTCPLCGGQVISRREVETDPYADTRQSAWEDYEMDGVTRHGAVCLQRLREANRQKEAA